MHLYEQVLPLAAALDTQGHNPSRLKPHNTNYYASNGTAPEFDSLGELMFTYRTYLSRSDKAMGTCEQSR